MEDPFASPPTPPEDEPKPQELEQATEHRPEREPASYEKALEAARFLRTHDIDPFEDLARHEYPAVLGRS